MKILILRTVQLTFLHFSVFVFTDNGGFDKAVQRAVIVGPCVVGVVIVAAIILVLVFDKRRWLKKNKSQNTSDVRSVESSAALSASDRNL